MKFSDIVPGTAKAEQMLKMQRHVLLVLFTLVPYQVQLDTANLRLLRSK
jgi:hypothetical protein